MDINSIHGAVFHIVYDNSESKTEEYRQKYQDAMDEVQRLNRVIDELKEQLQSTEKERHLMELANGFLAEMVDNLTDEVNALYVKLHDFNN
jgi:chromosome segregation ATPase